MTDETKQEIGAALMLLKNTLIRNGVSIALVGSEDTGKDDGCIMLPQSIVAPGNLKGYLLKQWI